MKKRGLAWLIVPALALVAALGPSSGYRAADATAAAGEVNYHRLEVGKVHEYRAESPHPYGRGVRDTVRSAGAKFIRVHFVDFDLAAGDSLVVSSADGTESWTYAGRGPNGNGDFWSFAVKGDTAHLELRSAQGNSNAYGYRIVGVGHGNVDLHAKPSGPTPEVLCGTDGREDVACRPETDSVEPQVARLLFTSGNSQYVCTGELIRGSNANTMITNYHCFSTQTEVNTVQATFDYQRATCTGAINSGTTYAGGTLLKTNSDAASRKKGGGGGLDYTLLTLQGNPEATYGELVPTTKAVAVGDPIWFVQHPGGNQKKVGYWEDGAKTVRCKADTINATYGTSAAGSQIGYACDSEGGSSGSAITDPATGNVIALHHYGNVDRSRCLNSGTWMRTICADAGSLLQCASN